VAPVSNGILFPQDSRNLIGMNNLYGLLPWKNVFFVFLLIFHKNKILNASSAIFQDIPDTSLQFKMKECRCFNAFYIAFTSLCGYIDTDLSQ